MKLVIRVQIDWANISYKHRCKKKKIIIISSHCELLLQQVHFSPWLARVREQLREDGLEVEVEPTKLKANWQKGTLYILGQ